jgi:hypothetical protein
MRRFKDSKQLKILGLEENAGVKPAYREAALWIY